MTGPAVGVDVGGTKILALAVDPDTPAGILARHRTPTPTDLDGLVDAVVSAVSAVEDQLGRRAGSVGVGLAGLVTTGGTFLAGPHLAATGVNMTRTLGERLDGRLGAVDNDANATAWAEWVTGAAAGRGDALVIAIGTGIGAGIVTGGRLLRGAHGLAGEPGHMVVVPGGLPCPCGRRGCWEQYASGTALGRQARDAVRAGEAPSLTRRIADPDALTGEDVTRAVADGDPDACRILDRWSDWVALGTANLVMLLDPEVVVIGGGVVDAAGLFLPRVADGVMADLMARDVRPRPEVVPAALGSDAAAIGAALLGAAGGGTSRAG